MLKTKRLIFVATGAICVALVGAAVYLQQTQGMLPCPKCIIQRYLFLAVALICFVSAALPERAAKVGAGLACLTSIGGIGAASWLLWVKANPHISCGIDPVEVALNKLPTAAWFPTLFEANGDCTTPYPPILGLDISQWSLLWFIALAVVLGWVAIKRIRH
jgi:disulfide bond formation protein DsbB